MEIISKRSSSARGIVIAKSHAAQGLRDLFQVQLKDIYCAEKVLTKALLKMIKNATSPELTLALKKQLYETAKHVLRLEQVFYSVRTKILANQCAAMEGLLKEGEMLMEETELGVVRDAGIITVLQKIKHYEIAAYGTLRAFASILGEDTAEELLAETLKEKKNEDAILNNIAMATINSDAADADDR